MTVIALVGPSGTGKSHRASMVADRYGAHAILDDGLLIVDGRIVAGRSAKREFTRMAAVKRAILVDAAHAEEIRAALSLKDPKRLLVLGTSQNMIDRIVDAIGWSDAAIEWVTIDEVASAEEINSARRERRNEGKHVIPAPTLEVQKTFSGYLVAPLHFIFFHHGRGRRVTVEKSIVRPTYSQLGNFYIADTVLATIAADAANKCMGIGEVGRVVVHSDSAGVRLEVEVGFDSGVGLFEVMAEVQESVRQAVESTTSLTVVEVLVVGRRMIGGFGQEVPHATGVDSR
jgi:hypothetical protein